MSTYPQSIQDETSEILSDLLKLAQDEAYFESALVEYAFIAEENKKEETVVEELADIFFPLLPKLRTPKDIRKQTLFTLANQFPNLTWEVLLLVFPSSNVLKRYNNQFFKGINAGGEDYLILQGRLRERAIHSELNPDYEDIANAFLIVAKQIQNCWPVLIDRLNQVVNTEFGKAFFVIILSGLQEQMSALPVEVKHSLYVPLLRLSMGKTFAAYLTKNNSEIKSKYNNAKQESHSNAPASYKYYHYFRSYFDRSFSLEENFIDLNDLYRTLSQLRSEILFEINSQEGIAGIHNIVKLTNQSAVREIAEACRDVDIAFENYIDFLVNYFPKEEYDAIVLKDKKELTRQQRANTKLADFCAELSGKLAGREDGDDWMNMVVQKCKDWPAEAFAKVIEKWPKNLMTWIFLEFHVPTSIKSYYWKNVQIKELGLEQVSAIDLLEVVLQLLDSDRALNALEPLSELNRRTEEETSEVCEIIDEGFINEIFERVRYEFQDTANRYGDFWDALRGFTELIEFKFRNRISEINGSDSVTQLDSVEPVLTSLAEFQLQFYDCYSNRRIDRHFKEPFVETLALNCPEYFANLINFTYKNDAGRSVLMLPTFYERKIAANFWSLTESQRRIPGQTMDSSEVNYTKLRDWSVGVLEASSKHNQIRIASGQIGRIISEGFSLRKDINGYDAKKVIGNILRLIHYLTGKNKNSKLFVLDECISSILTHDFNRKGGHLEQKIIDICNDFIKDDKNYVEENRSKKLLTQLVAEYEH